MRPTLFLIQRKTLADPGSPPGWIGRDDSSVSSVISYGAPSPIGLRGWRSREDAEKVKQFAITMTSTFGIGVSYEVVEMRPSN